MPRRVSPKRVASLQEQFLRDAGATDAEIRRWRPVLTAQIGAESNFLQGTGSPAGARDVAQFIPSTARSYGVTLGDNKIKDDIRGQVRYMLPLLRKYGVEDALRGYNAGEGAIDRSRGFSETNQYVSRVRGTAGRYGGLLGDPGGGGGQQTPSRGPTAAPDLPSLGIQPGPDTAGLLASLLGQQRQAPPSGQLRPSATAAHAALPAGYQGIQTSGGPAPRRDVSSLLEAVSGLSPAGPGIQAPQVPGDAQNGGKPGGRKPASSKGGTATFDGKPVLAKFLPELRWARAHGWNGTVTSGVRTKAQQLAAAKSFGLQHYGPAGPLGSNHVEGHRGAVDVSDPDSLEAILRRYPGRRRLRRGMADDPVHFSPTGH